MRIIPSSRRSWNGCSISRPSPAKYELLLHLERCGFAGAPRYLGIDAKGREIFSFVDGFAPPHNGFALTAQALRAGARLVRQVHDLTEGTRLLPAPRWPVIETCHSPISFFAT
jgi:hypothetical protein